MAPGRPPDLDRAAAEFAAAGQACFPPPPALKARRRTLAFGRRTYIMGILNLTPDSFSDGGRYAAPRAALRHALRMVDEGADILDIGGESTRPGSVPIGLRDELRRVVPVLELVIPALRPAPG